MTNQFVVAEDDDGSFTIGGKIDAMVPIDSLLPADSPRLAGQDEAHARVLAELDEPLPPVLVHRPTMRIIDGMHRHLAARLRGQETISVQWVTCDIDDAFILAVRENVAHGLPLTLADRRAAAERVIELRPQWSDRFVASVTGLGANTVGRIRHRSTATAKQSNTRIGRDGRTRPVNGAAGRERAMDILAVHPELPLREVARQAGISVGTAHAVRLEIAQGTSSMPRTAPADSAGGGLPAPGRGIARTTLNDSAPGWPVIRVQLSRDPALRYVGAGRALIQWLDTHAVDGQQWRPLIDAVPAHWSQSLAELARRCAVEWLRFAQELNQRTDERPTPTSAEPKE